MKFNSQKSFGYPVLRSASDDYVQGSFEPSITVTRVEKNDHSAIFEGIFSVSVPELSQLIQDEKASYVVVINCRNTFHRECFKTFDKEYIFEVGAKYLNGTISIESYIVAEQDIKGFQCAHIHQDFGAKQINFKKGWVLAQKEPENFVSIPDKFKSMTGLITMASRPDMTEGEWYFDINTERPVIYASDEQIKIFRSSIKGRPRIILLNSLVMPVVTSMIQLLVNEERGDANDNLDDRFLWPSIIKDALDKQGETLSVDSIPHLLAQKFLGLPQRKLNAIIVEE